MARVCTVGAGPAGSTLAARLAQLGHEVTLVERARFPRQRLGESLSPGVLPLLEVSGARARVEAAGFPHVERVHVDWGWGHEERRDPRAEGRLVDRGRFDALLVENAREHGVRVLQPATLRERRAVEGGWRLVLEADGGAREERFDLLVDACGRGGLLPGRRRRSGPRTFALHAWWRAETLSEVPRIEAGEDAWYWGVPLPDGTHDALVFVDPERLRAARGAPLAVTYEALLERSALFEGAVGARRVSEVFAVDATPYVTGRSATPNTLKVGDAALALDPLSSSGVQKAIQGALSGAVVAHTVLERPESAELAHEFQRTSLTRAAERHAGWAAAHYAELARVGGGAFWGARAAGARPTEPEADVRGGRLVPGLPLLRSPELDIEDVACLAGDFVVRAAALRHPELPEPVAWLGGREIAPLLRSVRDGMTPLDVARAWSDEVPMDEGLTLVEWLVARRLFTQVDRAVLEV